jgi:protein-S-isoprenylcysteine O-methyltransferase Ste14
MDEPPVFAFTEAALFWVAFIWAFLPEIHLSGSVTATACDSQDAGTFRLVNTGNDVSLFLAFTLSFLPWFIIPYPRIALYAGTGLLVTGSLLRRYCFRSLGKYFTAVVKGSVDQPVIDNGPYHWIRHPGYTVAFVMLLGIGLALSNWLSLIILFLAACYVYGHRVKAEEKGLLGTIGEPYRAYMARTMRFIPFVF